MASSVAERLSLASNALYQRPAREMSLIWIGHIGLDRVPGYGLKYPTSFQFTHIQSATNPVIVPNYRRAQNK
jgi:Domain of unknown function (DUF4260)